MLRGTADAGFQAAKQRFGSGNAFRRAVGLAPTSPDATDMAEREAAEYGLAQAITALNQVGPPPDPVEPWIGRITEAGTPELLDELTSAAEELRDTAGTLSAPYRPDAWRRIDGAQVGAAQRAAQMKWWPARALAERRLRRLLIDEGDLPAGARPDIRTDARALASLRMIHSRIEKIRRKLPCELPTWTPERISPLSTLAKRARELQLATCDERLYDTPAKTADGRRDRERVAACATQATERGSNGEPGNAVGQVANALVQAHERLIDANRQLNETMAPRKETPDHATPGGPWSVFVVRGSPLHNGGYKVGNDRTETL